MIVVDHHTVPSAGTVHPAFELVNPFRADSTFPFRGMASVGLMFYVAASLSTELRARDWYASRPIPDVRDLLDLVALGTIADLVPLSARESDPDVARAAPDPDRVHARGSPRCCSPRVSTSVHRSTQAPSAGSSRHGSTPPAGSGPRSRRSHSCSRTRPRPPACAEALEAANTERRAIQERVVEEAIARLEANGAGDPGAAIVIAGEGWAPGVVGIVAAKLVDRYQRPAFVIGIDPETGLGRGSARTCAGVDLYKVLATAAPFLDRFGGHAAAAGFTLDRGQVDALRETLTDSVTRVARPPRTRVRSCRDGDRATSTPRSG